MASQRSRLYIVGLSWELFHTHCVFFGAYGAVLSSTSAISLHVPPKQDRGCSVH